MTPETVSNLPAKNDFYSSILRPLAFCLDPEFVHGLAMMGISRGFFQARPFTDTRLAQTFFGVKFANPLGLAAGFDKNAEALSHWHQLGFGFAEIGTVTRHPQPGNDRPRMFRVPAEQALINRLGFNNNGASLIAGRLAAASPKIPIGVNIGKSMVAPLEEAAPDYAEAFRLLHSFGSYFVLNVSSPNTPGLRELQDKLRLKEIVNACLALDGTRPIFVKVSPDLDTTALDDVVALVHELKLAGIVATNTSTDQTLLRNQNAQTGGISGMPIRERSNALLAHLFRSCDPSVLLMGVGGIFDGDDLYRKVCLGAHLAQVYTGWVYGGPHMVPKVLARFVELLARDGFSHVSDARGVAAPSP